MRILLANEPRSHREVFAGALRALRPHVETITVNDANQNPGGRG